ncbi:uncharacterized protein [Rutidosis leptorrhynchoides]|uniref:uncharacterized protein n=1 Tax=Rutidosis leptorrhynchoides TaxID=125765 RepID=UPI003A99533C
MVNLAPFGTSIGSGKINCVSYSRVSIDLKVNKKLQLRIAFQYQKAGSNSVALEPNSISNNKDSWAWSLSSNGSLTVKKLAVLIDEKALAHFASLHLHMRNKLIPKKVEIFVWRLLHKRLPVRTELDKRGLDLNSVRCPLCDGDIESVDHIFTSCKLACDIWGRVAKWWNLRYSSHNSIEDVLKVVGFSSISHSGKSILQAIFWVSAYAIWRNRNNMVFQGKRWGPPVALNEIQTLSFDWIAARVKEKKLDWLTWISNLSIYLSS